jgi:putative transposase
MVYHVLNRSAGRTRLFRTDKDFLAFQRIMLEALDRQPMRLLAYCLMENHWHFVAWPRKDGELTAFFRWLTHTHAMRWRVAHHTVGYGHLYQGRFKSFPIQRDEHFLTVCRYVERNALNAGAVERAEDYRWSSLYVRQRKDEQMLAALSDWPVQRRSDWLEHVNEPLTRAEVLKLEASLKRSRPFGSDKWIASTALKLDLQHTLRREGRPSKKQAGDEADGEMPEN